MGSKMTSSKKLLELQMPNSKEAGVFSNVDTGTPSWKVRTANMRDSGQ